MFEKAYLIMGCTELLLLMILISKYIYFEQLLHHVRSWCIYLMLFLVCEVLASFMNNGDLSQIALPFVFFSGIIFFTRKSKKIRGIFITVPVTGMILSLVILPVSLIFLFSGSMISAIDHSASWIWIYDILFLSGFFLFFWKVKRRFDESVINRTLSTWERNLINMTGLFLFIFTLLIVCVDEFKIASFTQNAL
ncbi:hypothetical protein [Lacrimispora xylanisolvens]|uniref:hypothetical protein n=1 Tax=Lacrimispora xylanisolvens TaxID=384636 RepID=UPI002402AD4B